MPFLSAPAPAVPVDCERKFVANVGAHDGALALLRLHCLPDPRYDVGWIESIYYDNPWLSSYWEKADGDALKRKVRIRWYPGGTPPSDGRLQAFLEVKDRLCAGRDKLHRGFMSDWQTLQCAPLQDPALTALLYRQAELANVPLPEGLVPTVSIRYHRYRFVCPLTGARISLDSGLRSDRANPSLLPHAATVELARIVCEAKSAAHRDWPWCGALARLGFRAESFSKYGEFMESRMRGGR